MFADDIVLVREMVAKYGPLSAGPIVDVGGLERPCVADYQKTIDLMAAIEVEFQRGGVKTDAMIRDAQYARYLDIHRPLSFLGDYIIENPETGGLGLEDLWTRYEGEIGTAIVLSVLEHVSNPFEAVDALGMAMRSGGLAIVSVPFCFPFHPSPKDCFRFTPDGLRNVFSYARDRRRWEILEADWRLDIPSEAGVLDIKTNRAQAIKSCYIVARAI